MKQKIAKNDKKIANNFVNLDNLPKNSHKK